MRQDSKNNNMTSRDSTRLLMPCEFGRELAAAAARPRPTRTCARLRTACLMASPSIQRPDAAGSWPSAPPSAPSSSLSLLLLLLSLLLLPLRARCASACSPAPGAALLASLSLPSATAAASSKNSPEPRPDGRRAPPRRGDAKAAMRSCSRSNSLQQGFVEFSSLFPLPSLLASPLSDKSLSLIPGVAQQCVRRTCMIMNVFFSPAHGTMNGMVRPQVGRMAGRCASSRSSSSERARLRRPKR